MPAKLEQVHRKLLRNQWNLCVGIRMHESHIWNEWPWAIRRASHVIQTMATEWVNWHSAPRHGGQHCNKLETSKKRKSLPLSIQSTGSKSPNENVCWTKCLCERWMKLGMKKKHFFLSTELCVRGFVHQFKRIERNRGGQEILLNGKAAWLCQCASIFFFKKKREEGINSQRGWMRGPSTEAPRHQNACISFLRDIHGRWYLHSKYTQTAHMPNLNISVQHAAGWNDLKRMFMATFRVFSFSLMLGNSSVASCLTPYKELRRGPGQHFHFLVAHTQQ